MNEVLEKIQKIGIVPVVVLDDAKDAAPLARHFARAVFRALRYIPYSCSRRVHPYYGKRIPGDVSWRRYCSYN